MQQLKEVWTLTDIQNIEPLEHDYQEFKASAFVAQPDGTLSSEFLYKFSKQISAFSNGNGGKIFLGVQDDGTIDSGLPTRLKPGGTKAWLENTIIDSVIPRLKEYNVFEVPLENGNAVYVVDIPRSPLAPHQAKDSRYYVRISGMSRPMGHLHVEDIFRRNKTPQMDIVRLSPYQAPEVFRDEHGMQVLQAFRLHLSNNGTSMAQHVGGEVSIPRHYVTRVAREKTLEQQKIHYTQKPSEMMFFHYLGIPIFPSQEVYFMIFWVGFTKTTVEQIRNGLPIRIRIYADDSIPKEQIEDLTQFTQVKEILQMSLL